MSDQQTKTRKEEKVPNSLEKALEEKDSENQKLIPGQIEQPKQLELEQLPSEERPKSTEMLKPEVSAEKKPSEQQEAKEKLPPLKPKTEKLEQKIEEILDKNLEKLSRNLSPEVKKKLDQNKKATVQRVFYLLKQGSEINQEMQAQNAIKTFFIKSLATIKDFILVKNKQNALRHKIEKIVYKFLSGPPGQNKYYLRQQTKIIVDEIMNLVENEIIF